VSLFSQWLMPFRDMGASTISNLEHGGTDHQSFDGIGLPGFHLFRTKLNTTRDAPLESGRL